MDVDKSYIPKQRAYKTLYRSATLKSFLFSYREKWLEDHGCIVQYCQAQPLWIILLHHMGSFASNLDWYIWQLETLEIYQPDHLFLVWCKIENGALHAVHKMLNLSLCWLGILQFKSRRQMKLEMKLLTLESLPINLVVVSQSFLIAKA